MDQLFLNNPLRFKNKIKYKKENSRNITNNKANKNKINANFQSQLIAKKNKML